MIDPAIIADYCAQLYNRFMFDTDCHFHLFAAHRAQPGARYVPRYGATLEDWVAASGGVGVSRGVVVQPSFLGDDNSQLLAALARAPQALRGVAVVSVQASPAVLAGLVRAGVRGVRLNCFGVADDVASLRALPTAWWDAIALSGLHIELHSNVGRIPALLPLIPSELVLVLDHFAKPEAASARDATVRAVAARAQTYVKLSAAYRQAAHVAPSTLAALWGETLGSAALLWGSDWPCTNFEARCDYPRVRAELDEALSDAAERAQVLAGNAQRLYWR